MRHQPNILMLQVDQLSVSALRAHGNRGSMTPAIDRLAGAGVVFENACTNFPVCASSRFSMMRDRLASAIEAWDNAAEFRVSIPPMAHYLRVEPRWSGQAARGARVMSGLPIAARSRREEVRS